MLIALWLVPAPGATPGQTWEPVVLLLAPLALGALVWRRRQGELRAAGEVPGPGSAPDAARLAAQQGRLGGDRGPTASPLSAAG